VLAKAIHFDRTVARRWFTYAYLGVSIAVGTVVLFWVLLHWRSDDKLRFASFLATALIASVLRIRLPGLDGNISVSVLFILVGVVDLSLPEALIIGTLSALIQSVWRSHAKLVQTAFSVCTLATAIYLSGMVYEYARSRTSEIVALGVLALLIFMVRLIWRSLRQVISGRWMPAPGLMQGPRVMERRGTQHDESEML